MAGRGPAPDAQRVRRGKPERGDWKPSPDKGWQHDLPEPPPGLLASSAAVWEGWFRSWWAGHWTPDDLPQLRLVIRLWDRVHRGDIKRLGELRQLMDSFGITPKGQMDRRWERPPAPKPPTALERIVAAGRERAGRYDHLRDPKDPRYRPQSVKDRFAVLEQDARDVEARRYRVDDER